MNKPLRNVYLIGMTGVGKTSVGKILANKLHWAFVDVNETIEAIYGRNMKEIFLTFGEESFRNMETTMLKELSQGEHQVFACNSDSVLDQRKLQTMKRTGITIWLDAPFQDLVERIEQMEEPTVPEGEMSIVIQQMIKTRENYYQQADVRVSTDKSTPEVTAEKIIQVLYQIR